MAIQNPHSTTQMMLSKNRMAEDGSGRQYAEWVIVAEFTRPWAGDRSRRRTRSSPTRPPARTTTLSADPCCELCTGCAQRNSHGDNSFPPLSTYCDITGNTRKGHFL